MQTNITKQINQDLNRTLQLQKKASDLLSNVLRELKKREVKTSSSY